MLRAECARAPEPVGVPAPQVVVDAERVGRLVLDRAVVDLLTRVVAGVRRVVAEGRDGEVHLVRGEDDPVERIDTRALVLAAAHDLFDCIRRPGDGIEPYM